MKGTASFGTHEAVTNLAIGYTRPGSDDPLQISPQSLWLAARIEYRAGNRQAADDLGQQLRGKFPKSREAAEFEQGRFDG